jgi:hypothetical protein
MPTALDGHVGTQSVGQFVQSAQHVVTRVQGRIGTESLGGVSARRGGVDDDDCRRCQQPCRDDGSEADRAGAHDDDHVTRADGTRGHPDLERGGQDVGEHERRLVADRVGQRVRRRVRERNPNLLGLRAVDAMPEDPPAAAEALPVPRLAAEAAPAAGADAGDQHAVTRLNPADPGADLGHGADGLVTEDPRRLSGGHVPLEDVQVRSADGDRVHAHDGVLRVLDHGIRDVLPGPPAGTVVDQRSHVSLLVEGGVGSYPSGRLGHEHVADLATWRGRRVRPVAEAE